MCIARILRRPVRRLNVRSRISRLTREVGHWSAFSCNIREVPLSSSLPSLPSRAPTRYHFVHWSNTICLSPLLVFLCDNQPEATWTAAPFSTPGRAAKLQVGYRDNDNQQMTHIVSAYDRGFNLTGKTFERLKRDKRVVGIDQGFIATSQTGVTAGNRVSAVERVK